MYNFIHSLQRIDDNTSICNNGYSSLELDPWPCGSSVIKIVCCVDNSSVLCTNLKY